MVWFPVGLKVSGILPSPQLMFNLLFTCYLNVLCLRLPFTEPKHSAATHILLILRTKEVLNMMFNLAIKHTCKGRVEI